MTQRQHCSHHRPLKRKGLGPFVSLTNLDDFNLAPVVYYPSGIDGRDWMVARVAYVATEASLDRHAGHPNVANFAIAPEPQSIDYIDLHAASPDRDRNSACHKTNETSPPVCWSIRRAVSASGNRSPLRYRLTVGCVLPIASASTVSVQFGRSRYAAKADR